MALGLSLPGVTAEGLCHVQVAVNSQKFSGRNGVAAAPLGTVAGGTVPVWRQNPGIRRDLWDPPLFPASWKQRWGFRDNLALVWESLAGQGLPRSRHRSEPDGPRAGAFQGQGESRATALSRAGRSWDGIGRADAAPEVL